MKHRIEFGKDYIRIYKGKKEIVGWTIDEWVEDPQIVFSICNAIRLAYKGNLEGVLLGGSYGKNKIS